MGLNDMVGRVQDAITGRFLSADPHITDPTDPQSYNRFSYVVNSPLTYVDPTGFQEATLGQIVITPGSSDGGLTSAGGAGGSTAADGTGPSPADQLGQQIEARLNTYIAHLLGKPATPSELANPPQQSNPPTVPNLPQVTITATSEIPPPTALPPAITPGLIALDYDMNFL